MADQAAEGQEIAAGIEGLEQLSAETIPQAFQQLTQSRDTITQIVEFCKGSYSAAGSGAEISEEKMAEAFAQTRKYTSNVLLNVSYHVQNLAAFLMSYVDGQLDEVDRMLTDTKAVAEKLRSHYHRNGSEVFRPAESTRVYDHQPKSVKLTGLLFLVFIGHVYRWRWSFLCACACGWLVVFLWRTTGDDLPEYAKPLSRFQRNADTDKSYA